MVGFRFISPACIAGCFSLVVAVAQVAPAFAVSIVEAPAEELATHCAMEFADVPADRVIACRAPDGRLFVPPMLSYNEQGFIIQTQDLIDDFCSRKEAALPIIPVSADLTPGYRAHPPISSDNIACR